MDEVPPTTAYARVAVECLTLWLEPDRVSAALHVALLKQDPDEVAPAPPVARRTGGRGVPTLENR
jgi:hypothetical protein